MIVVLHIFSSGFWYDSRLRCDVADLYFKLYGRKRPYALPIPELAMLHHRGSSSSQIKSEKSKADVSFYCQPTALADFKTISFAEVHHSKGREEENGA